MLFWLISETLLTFNSPLPPQTDNKELMKNIADGYYSIVQVCIEDHC